MTAVAGISRVVLPIGVNAVESVNCYVLPDGDRVKVVDCAVWRPDLPDGGLAALEAGLQGAGYALTDVGRIVVTHAHIDHYGLAGRLMELTGAELAMHAMTDLDCEKYRHPDTARARRRDTYADHGVSEDERGDLAHHLTRWLPYLHSVVEASRRLRGGEELTIGGDTWQVVFHRQLNRLVPRGGLRDHFHFRILQHGYDSGANDGMIVRDEHTNRHQVPL